jgi:exopolysaccharide production protein ExoZ
VAVAGADRLPGLQALRALAALAVVVFHAGRYVAGALPETAWRWGEFGVDVFFVVSGFVMMVATPPQATWRVFVARRAIRILPMYWLATLLMATLVLAAPHLFVSAALTPAHFVQSLLLWPHYNPALPGEVVPLLVPGWTLSYELYFYLVFALFLRLAPGARLVAIGVTLLLAMAVARSLEPSAPASFFARDLTLEFVFGMIAARLWQRGHRCPPALAWPLAAVAAAAIVAFASPEWRVPTAGGAAFVMTWALASAPLSRNLAARALTLLGDASYSLYLLHPFVVGAAWWAWQRAGFDSAIAFIVLCLAASALAGWIAWRVIEAPVTRALRRVA